jgi:hypothetical protein
MNTCKNRQKQIERIKQNRSKENWKNHNAVITKADKGNCIVILCQNDYHTKVTDFLENNNFDIETIDPTNTFQKDIRNGTDICQLIIPKDTKWKYISLNPSPPVIRGLIKVHKADSPISPVINWKNAPSYKLAKIIYEFFKIHIPFPYSFNVKTSVQLMNCTKFHTTTNHWSNKRPIKQQQEFKKGSILTSEGSS